MTKPLDMPNAYQSYLRTGIKAYITGDKLGMLENFDCAKAYQINHEDYLASFFSILAEHQLIGEIIKTIDWLNQANIFKDPSDLYPYINLLANFDLDQATGQTLHGQAAFFVLVNQALANLLPQKDGVRPDQDQLAASLSQYLDRVNTLSLVDQVQVQSLLADLPAEVQVSWARSFLAAGAKGLLRSDLLQLVANQVEAGDDNEIDYLNFNQRPAEIKPSDLAKLDLTAYINEGLAYIAEISQDDPSQEAWLEEEWRLLAYYFYPDFDLLQACPGQIIDALLANIQGRSHWDQALLSLVNQVRRQLYR
ncbi:hypothetical protein AWM75_00185 [Aerococcus urinaehominis]|uniref:Uncharacterized protein n=1 Tax=Aerococcus urinaehominis TaxID=128944 RepID=A0A0X8FJH9_9LACT|nr:hypothetical protein [Aerococcus urinaehominis]AMB98503.1 hypothetical protein AWM75_00185 [Aerococcus urinaehominis]SDL80436.1 hypothetical protein SAMN04487985_101110 [Aerococcus urinaehominis]